jgi:hypothetical protein
MFPVRAPPHNGTTQDGPKKQSIVKIQQRVDVDHERRLCSHSTSCRLASAPCFGVSAAIVPWGCTHHFQIIETWYANTMVQVHAINFVFAQITVRITAFHSLDRSNVVHVAEMHHEEWLVQVLVNTGGSDILSTNQQYRHVQNGALYVPQLERQSTRF